MVDTDQELGLFDGALDFLMKPYASFRVCESSGGQKPLQVQLVMAMVRLRSRGSLRLPWRGGV